MLEGHSRITISKQGKEIAQAQKFNLKTVKRELKLYYVFFIFISKSSINQKDKLFDWQSLLIYIFC